MNRKLLITSVIILVLSMASCATSAPDCGCDAKKKIRIACAGDSITYGFGLDNPSSYPSVLGNMLGNKYEVKNFGISSRTVLTKGDKPYIKEEIFNQAVQFRADILIIGLGTNDTKPQNRIFLDNFISDYKNIIDKFMILNPKLTVFILIPPPAITVPEESISGQVLESLVIPKIKELASQNGFKTIDMYTLFKNSPNRLSDGVHPDWKGYQMMAKTIAKSIFPN